MKSRLSVLLLVCRTAAFSISRSSTTVLWSSLETGVIRGIQQDEEIIDFQQGGVRLALEQVVVVDATIHPGTEPELVGLQRYTTWKEVSQDMLTGTIVATGRGLELYADPGTTTIKSVQYAPDDAMKDAMATLAGSAMDFDAIHINFCGGDDLQVFEVLEACQTFVLNGNVNPKAKVFSHSLSYKELAMGEATVTIIGIKDQASNNEATAALTGAAKTVAQGQVYWAKGKYWTVEEENINTDTE